MNPTRNQLLTAATITGLTTIVLTLTAIARFVMLA
jgi:hypothetical protein